MSSGGTLADQMQGLRALGARNFVHFKALHEAVIDFVGRHHKRLERHVKRGSAQGIPNFLHILFTLCLLLLQQIERIIAGFETQDTTQLPAQDWYDIRTHIADYYLALQHLLTCALAYVDAMEAGGEETGREFKERYPELMDNLWPGPPKPRYS
jgi:hypothetical protein